MGKKFKVSRKTKKIILGGCIGAMVMCVHRKKLNMIQAAAVLTLVVFLGIVFGSTVFTRTGTIRQYELVPFW